jgi:hypothetical protein
MKTHLISAAPILATFAWLTGLVRADEGMWPVNQFPKAAIQEKYGYEVTDQFLQNLQLASARFNNGGSGSFVSPDGLLFTNHHVGADCIQKLSTAAHDYMANGFYAATGAEETACPDLEVNVLLKIENVTPRVNANVKPGMDAAKANRERKASMAAIEKECSASTKNRCDVVTLFPGNRYDLYQYKKYTDIRLVFAPEYAIASFGGDPDNFTYPRFDLDFALFRAYENGRPAKIQHYFPWSRTGAQDGELAFVAGNPGTTGRLSTLSQLEFARDYSYPLVIDFLKTWVSALMSYMDEGAENKRAAVEDLQSAQNSLKAYVGFLTGLRDPALIGRKRDEEQTLRAKAAANPAQREQYAATWDHVAAAMREYREIYKPYWLLERNAGRGSDLFPIARDVLRLAQERRKPNDQRLREFRESALPSLEQSLYSPAPITPSKEIAMIANYLRFMEKEFGAADPVVKAALDGATPEQAAARYVNTSKLADVELRKKLSANADAALASDDGMMRLARIFDQPAREYRKRYEDKVEAVVNESERVLAEARFAAGGPSVYPDATFTFRIAYGPVKGYRLNGKAVPWATTFAGLYDHATGVEPFRLPERWVKSKASLNLTTPFNFVTTADTHGGNSGSPTLNSRGEIIGILFDGNIESLPNRFVYTEEVARSIHVASQGIIEALRNLYHADRIVKELGFGTGGPAGSPSVRD